MAQIVNGKQSSPVLIAVAWAVVVMPTLWGLNYTVQNALKIFARPNMPVSSPAASAPAN